MKVMCARGLFTLLLLDNLSDYDWLKVSIDLISAINSLFEI